jgi:hypothetical protein
METEPFDISVALANDFPAPSGPIIIITSPIST